MTKLSQGILVILFACIIFINAQQPEVVLDIPNGQDNSKGKWTNAGALTTKACTSGLSTGKTYTCFKEGGEQITYVDVETNKPHYALRIYNEILVWQSWDGRQGLNDYDKYYMAVDGQQILDRAGYPWHGLQQYCNPANGGWYDTQDKYTIDQPHTASAAKITIRQFVDQASNDEVLCWRDLKLWMLLCHSSCKSCFGPEENQCTQCPSGQMLKDKKCVKSDDSKTCTTFYDQCGYQGNKFTQCGQVYESFVNGPDFVAKSIQIPDGQQVTILSNDGKSRVLYSSFNCIQNTGFQLLKKNGDSNLRKDQSNEE